MIDTKRIDYEARGNNLYGCSPCPVCKSRYRYPRTPDLMLMCDECDHQEQGHYVWDEPGHLKERT